MYRRVVITGMGVLSPLGLTLGESWENVIAGNKGLSKLLDPDYQKLPCRIAGLIKEGGQPFDLSKRFPKSVLKSMGPATAYSLIATEEALKVEFIASICLTNSPYMLLRNNCFSINVIC